MNSKTTKQDLIRINNMIGIRQNRLNKLQKEIETLRTQGSNILDNQVKMIKRLQRQYNFQNVVKSEDVEHREGTIREQVIEFFKDNPRSTIRQCYEGIGAKSSTVYTYVYGMKCDKILKKVASRKYVKA